jgi:hypothetical protein
MAETMILSISGKVKNKFLKQIHQDATGIVHKMYGPNACFEELFGSLCGHSKGKDTISSLMEKLKKNNLLFSSKETGVDYIKSGAKSGIHKEGFNYLFAYLDEDGNVFIADVDFDSGGLWVHVHYLSVDDRWLACYAYRIVVPATKTLDTQS